MNSFIFEHLLLCMGSEHKNGLYNQWDSFRRKSIVFLWKHGLIEDKFWEWWELVSACPFNTGNPYVLEHIGPLHAITASVRSYVHDSLFMSRKFYFFLLVKSYRLSTSSSSEFHVLWREGFDWTTQFRTDKDIV